jgi:hydrogenase-4 component F
MIPILILLSPLAGSLISLVLGRRPREICCILSSFIALVLSTTALVSVKAEPELFLSGEVIMDGLGALVAFLISLIVFLASVYSPYYMNLDEKKHRTYYFLLQLFDFTMLSVCISNNIFLIWVFVEATTLSSVFLVALRGDPTSLEAGWKYVLLCTVGLSIALFGTVMLYVNALEKIGESGILWTELMRNKSVLDGRVLETAVIFLIAGYGVKAGLFPFHWWLPDAYSEAPTPVSSVLSGVLINCSFLAIARFYLLSPSGIVSSLLMFFGIISAIFGSIAMIRQVNMKRLLAYSSVENMGIACIGLGAGGIGITFSIFHVFNHGLLKSAAFLSWGGVERSNKTGGVPPSVAFSLVLSFILLGGCPPAGIFLSELGILTSVVRDVSVAVLYLISTFVSFSVLSYSAMEKGLGKMLAEKSSFSAWIIPVISSTISIAAGLYPIPILHIIEEFLGGVG